MVELSETVGKSTRQQLSTDDVTRWSESFDALLSHEHGLAAFRKFLKTEFSDENIEFWMACEDYKKITPPEKLGTRANKIYEEFINVQAPREINIDFHTRELTKQNLVEPSTSSFSEAQARVYMLMEKDSYPRFIRSKVYMDLLNQTQTQCQSSVLCSE
ncbi:regulator of G-protein signaling 8-like [Anguilla rostrata]|uniref:regulator of G-protein signaling 8-like n=1 Tax=Anguilla anguilla TaxID=7936 RepID=UPI0015AD4096|nr:regulator of G-protein signaling 8-like [Anguilla anguilla]